MIQLNIGSGQRPFASPWLNVDHIPRHNPDVVSDARSLPYDDDSVGIIMLHHVLEHFDPTDAASVIREAWRVLAPTGSLIVIVPDAVELAKAVISGRIDADNFAIHMVGAYMGDEGDRHKWHYTPTTLRRLLNQQPWRWIGDFNWRQMEGADVAAKDFWFFGLECVK